MNIAKTLLKETEEEKMDIARHLALHIMHSNAAGLLNERLARFGEELQGQTENYVEQENIEQVIRALRQITPEKIFRQTVDQTIAEVYREIIKLFGPDVSLQQIGGPDDRPQIAALLEGLENDVRQKVINVVWAGFILLSMQKVIDRWIEQHITTEAEIDMCGGPADIVTNQLYEKYGVVPGTEDGWSA